jgi:mono/diheme cytochrome c family protein
MRLATLGFCVVLAGCLRGETTIVARVEKVVSKKEAPPGPVVRTFSGAARGSPVQLAAVDGRTYAWIADGDAAALHVVDLGALEIVTTLALGGAPSELVMLEDGSLVAALRDTSELVRISPGLHPAVHARLDVATEPVGLALSKNELFVTSGWGRTLTAVAMDRFARDWKVEVDREPRDVVLSDGHAIVTHAIGQTVEIVNIDSHAVEKKLLRGRREGGFQTTGHPIQGFALATDGTRIFAPRALAQTERATDFMWMSKPGPEFVIDEKGNRKIKRAETSDSYGGAVDSFPPETLDVAVLDAKGEPDLESLALRTGFPVATCALPRAALATSDGRLFVACLGSDIVAELDGGVPSPHHAEIRRTKVPAGPTGLAWDDRHESVVVWSQFARQLSLLPSGPIEDGKALAAVTIPPIDSDAKLALGRVLFHATADTRISKDGRACASCHPDGRDDGLVWQTKDGPRQTAMLSGRLEGTAPYGWLGQSKDVADHLKTRTFKRLGGSGLPNADLDALTLYVKTLRPPEPKRTAMGEALVREGETIFNSSRAECANCHGGDGRTPDGLDHVVWSQTRDDTTGLFDTPSLRHVAQTAPYFHDGRYATLDDLLRKVDGTMGHTKQLTPHELEALEAFLVTR